MNLIVGLLFIAGALLVMVSIGVIIFEIYMIIKDEIASGK